MRYGIRGQSPETIVGRRIQQAAVLKAQGNSLGQSVVQPRAVNESSLGLCLRVGKGVGLGARWIEYDRSSSGENVWVEFVIAESWQSLDKSEGELMIIRRNSEIT